MASHAIVALAHVADDVTEPCSIRLIGGESICDPLTAYLIFFTLMMHIAYSRGRKKSSCRLRDAS